MWSLLLTDPYDIRIAASTFKLYLSKFHGISIISLEVGHNRYISKRGEIWPICLTNRTVVLLNITHIYMLHIKNGSEYIIDFFCSLVHLYHCTWHLSDVYTPNWKFSNVLINECVILHEDIEEQAKHLVNHLIKTCDVFMARSKNCTNSKHVVLV